MKIYFYFNSRIEVRSRPLYMYISHFPDKDTCPEYINILILHLLVVITKISILGNGNDDDDYDNHRA